MKWLTFLMFVSLISENVTAQDVWNIKAIDPHGRFIDVKALDKAGKIYDVKAFEMDNSSQFMDVKAIKDGKKMAIKVLVSTDVFAPVKAIGDNGEIFDIKAVTKDNIHLDVKGVSSNGSIVNIKAVSPDGDFYGIKAISKDGILHDVKGIKFSSNDVESVLQKQCILMDNCGILKPLMKWVKYMMLNHLKKMGICM